MANVDPGFLPSGAESQQGAVFCPKEVSRGWQRGAHLSAAALCIISYGLKVRIRLLLFESPCRLLRNFFPASMTGKKQLEKTPP
jgi:hypothetical protein